MKTKTITSGFSFKHWFLALALFLLSLPNSVFGQVDYCQFDRLLEEMMNEGEFEEQMLLNEQHMQEMLNDPDMQELVNESTVYTVPVVVHIMHLGEAQGSGSNISDAQIIQAIADLNADFSPIDIQFCLAERDPDGSAHTGINRVDASDICAGLCYTSGMQISGALANAVKAASLWPNTDYVNIWVVHQITGALGYATFPGASANTDGIVMDDDYFGIAGSNVLTHEAGHYLDLYHSFQGDCPPGTNCNTNNCINTICPPADPLQGDMVADTPPHKRSCFSCDFSGTNTCDGNSPNTLFGSNYMNYADIPCLADFTDGQRVRMRCALMELRPELLNSLGCVPGCTSAMADFTPSVLGGEQGITITFTNTSTGATDYLWEVEDQSSTTTDFTYTFQNQGTFDVCLTASNATCTNRICVLIEITGPDPCYEGLEECNLVLNGNLEQNNYGLDGVCHMFVDQNGNSNCDVNGVCNWGRKRSTPAFCSETNGENTFIMADWREAIVSIEELQFVDGQTCILSFEYFEFGQDINENRDPVLSFGLIETPDFIGLGGDFTEYIRVLGTVENPPVDAVGGYPECPPSGTVFNYFEMPVTFNGDDPRHLYFTFERTLPQGSASYMHIRDIRIDCCGDVCQAEPEIQYEQDECTFSFIGLNTGDPGDCYWDFGDGTTSEECDVVHTYTAGGSYTVCLTIVCDENSSTTVCEVIVVPEDCVEESCEAVLVQFGYGDDCDDDDDDFDPINISPCISDVSDLGPYNGNGGASCLGGTICVASMVNGWEFSITSAEPMEVSYIIASLLYPINDETAGGTANESHCSETFPNFPYVFNFYLNNDDDLNPDYTINGTIAGSTTNTFSEETISLLNPIVLNPDDVLRVRIDGLATDPDCDLFELNGLSVHGCCTPCPVDLVDLGPDQTICAGGQVVLNGTGNTHGTVVRRIDERRDDGEEEDNGDMHLYSSDLEMVDDGGIQTVGIRFNEINIPQGAVITNAFVQFTADEEDDEPTNLTVHGEDTDNALEFSNTDFDITSRPTTIASVAWSPGAWYIGDAGLEQQTPDLIAIVQEIVDKPGWGYGNSLAFIISGSGKRVAESTSGEIDKAPELVIEYELSGAGLYTYLWSTGETSESITVNPATTTTYSVTVTDANDCTDTDEVTITVDDCCSDLNVVVDCREGAITLSAYLNGDLVDPVLYNVQWEIAGIGSGNSTNPLTVNGNAEGSTYSVDVSQEEMGTCHAEGVISCEGRRGSFTVFPNPSNKGDQLYLSSTDQRFLNQEVRLTVTNEIGIPVSSERIILGEITALPRLRTGVCLIHILNNRTGQREIITFYIDSK